MKITELGTPLEFIAEKLVGNKANIGLESTLWSCVSCFIVSFFLVFYRWSFSSQHPTFSLAKSENVSFI